MDSLLQDLRYGARSLWHGKLFSFAAVLALAIGIGATSAIFSVLDAVVLKPLPFPAPDRLVRIYSVSSRGERAPLAAGDVVDFSKARTNFAGIASLGGRRLNVLSPDGPEQLRGAEVSASFLSVLGARPALGRDFEASDEGEGAAPVVRWPRR